MSMTGLLQRGDSWAFRGEVREDVAATAPKEPRTVRLSMNETPLILAGFVYANSLFSAAGGFFQNSCCTAIRRNVSQQQQNHIQNPQFTLIC
jgi:hypothetical protein